MKMEDKKSKKTFSCLTIISSVILVLYIFCLPSICVNLFKMKDSLSTSPKKTAKNHESSLSSLSSLVKSQKTVQTV